MSSGPLLPEEGGQRLAQAIPRQKGREHMLVGFLALLVLALLIFSVMTPESGDPSGE